MFGFVIISVLTKWPSKTNKKKKKDRGYFFIIFPRAVTKSGTAHEHKRTRLVLYRLDD